ncbi:MAG: GNAT family N-acetyltransferase, partial [Actinomycetota bacterium]|nr:GNAT family N-acetyltransferase [Actinomycetota bacterium]
MTTLTQTTDLGIRKAGPADRDTVAATIAAAFHDDPVCHWLLPDDDRRRAVLEPVFQVYVDAYLAHDHVYLTADNRGAAVWLPPATPLLTPESEEDFVSAMIRIAGPDVDRMSLLEETFALHHPSIPHYYLQFLAVAPETQSRGIGSALLREGLERSDAEGVPVYFES